MSETVWIEQWASATTLDFIENRDGVSWADAMIPRRLHRCKAQTRGIMGTFLVFRCACGSISRNERWWTARNSSRKHRHRVVDGTPTQP